MEPVNGILNGSVEFTYYLWNKVTSYASSC